jgi:hypothetical protein
MERRRRSSRSKHKVRRVLKKIKPALILKLMLYGLGIWCFFYSKDEYDTTLISFKAVLIIGLVSGTILSFIIERGYKYYLFTIILLGSLVTAAFFKVNRSFASSKEDHIEARILAKTLQSNKIDRSRVSIEFGGFERDIDIDRIQEYKLGPSDFIILTARKGGLGYFIVTYKELIEQ